MAQTFFDQLMKDFMTAVCGEGAEAGSCARLSVIQQLSTMPSWMYVGGMSLGDVPENPYVPTPKGHKQYEEGKALVDTTCETMARHIGRVVGWYTNGGFHDVRKPSVTLALHHRSRPFTTAIFCDLIAILCDVSSDFSRLMGIVDLQDCGHWHHSGLKYKWYGLSILNEDEHDIRPEGGIAYTRCFDAVVRQLQKINSTIVPVGPEISGGCSFPGSQFEYLSYTLNKSNHVDGTIRSRSWKKTPLSEPCVRALFAHRSSAQIMTAPAVHADYTPLIGSYHIGINGDGLTMPAAEGFYTQWDGALSGFVPAADKLLAELQSPAKLILNEFVNSVQDVSFPNPQPVTLWTLAQKLDFVTVCSNRVRCIFSGATRHRSRMAGVLNLPSLLLTAPSPPDRTL